MILVCIVKGKEVDRITITGQSVSYTTRAAEEIVQTKIDALGHTKAMNELRSWSNGYVTITETQSS